MSDIISQFNSAGVSNNEFIAELTDSAIRKQDQLYFALKARGLAGDPNFGIGLGDSVMEANDYNLKRTIEKRLTDTIPDLITNVSFDGAAITQDPANKLVNVDIFITDLDSGTEIDTPVAVARKGA